MTRRKIEYRGTCAICGNAFTASREPSHQPRGSCSRACHKALSGRSKREANEARRPAHKAFTNGRGEIVCLPDRDNQLSWRQMAALAELPPDIRQRLGV